MASSSFNVESGMITHWAFAPGVTSLTASYCLSSQELTISAEGNTNLIVHGFEFERDPHFVGGLRYKLMGWIGPAVAKSTRYERTQVFRIAYVPSVMNLDVLFVCDADHPNGVKVDIKWDGPKPDTPSKTAAPEPSSQIAAPFVNIPEPIDMFVLYKVPFKISVAAQLTGTTIKFDPEFFQLQDASIDDGQLLWTLCPIRTGSTQVIVRYTSLSPLALGNERIFNIAIGFPVPATATSDKKLPGAILSFLGGVNIAVRQVRSQWPDAELYHVNCTAPRGPVYPRNSATGISQLTVLFRDGDKGTIQITDKGWWSDWNKAVYKPGLLLGNKNISWPPSKETWDLGLEDAVEALFKVPDAPPTFWSCELFEPLKPQEGGNQPLYLFTMVDTSTWIVGAKDGKVSRGSSGAPATQSAPAV